LIIGIDTMVLIYAEVVPPKPGPRCEDYDELRARSKLLLLRISNQDMIVLPTVAIAELLVPLTPTQKGPMILEFQERFLCYPLDIRAADLASGLWAQYKQGSQVPHEQAADQAQATSTAIKRDALIVACARAANAERFYSHDGECRKLAELAGMEALDLPTGDTLEAKYLLRDIQAGDVPPLRVPEKIPATRRTKKK